MANDQFNLFKTPQLTKPIQVYDPTKSVEDNMVGKGTPSAQNIVSAYQTPQAQLQLQQPQPQQKQQTQPTLDGDSSTAGMDYLNSLYTDPKEEERLRKASVMNQRILAIGDAIRHIGNIANTVNYAPAQRLNNPVAEEQARYERGKALRDRANQQYFTYQQAKAAQDAKMKQWEQQFRYNAEKDARDYELRKKESDARAKYNEAKILNQNTLAELNRLREAGIISDNEWRKQRAEMYPAYQQSIINRNNRTGGGRRGSRGGSGSNMPDYEVITENTLNDDGRVVSQKKTRTVKRDGQSTTTTTTKKKNPMGSSSSSTTGQGKKRNPMS